MSKNEIKINDILLDIENEIKKEVFYSFLQEEEQQEQIRKMLKIMSITQLSSKLREKGFSNSIPTLKKQLKKLKIKF